MVLPYPGLKLVVSDVEPSSLVDIKRFIARAYIVGEAAGSAGNENDLEVDIWPFTGTYVAEDSFR